MSQQKGFAVVMKDFFGYRSGEAMSQFMAELKALSYEEKCWFAGELRKAGFDCADPLKPGEKPAA